METQSSDWFAGWLFGWFILSIAISVLAASRNRNAVGWFFVSVLTSPLLAFIILMVSGPASPPVTATSSETATAPPSSSRKLQGADVVLRFEQLRQLRDKDLLTAAEHAARKQKIFNELSGRTLLESAEDFLMLLLPLKENGALTADEVIKLKAFALENVAPTATVAARGGADAPASMPCPKCNRLIHPKATTCMHCWAKVPAA